MFRTNLLFIFVVCAGGIAHSQSGLIRGRLLDSNGNAVANADVYAMFFLHCDIPNETAKLKIESGAEDGCLSLWDGRVDATTDELGDFALRELEWGVYELAAQKPEDGYRSTFRNLFVGELPLRVVLTSDSPYADRTLHLPPKCALLTGTVRNAKTGELLSGVTLVMSPKDGHGWREFTGATVPMHILIPSEREFTLEISAAGFDAWVYRNLFDEISTGDAPAILKLRAGEQVSLDIALTPKANRRQLTVPQSKSRQTP